MAYYVGIDGGGSKTTCVVGDEGSTLATATTSGSNLVRLGGDRARAALHDAVRQACTAAGVTPQQVSRCCAGLAGAARPEIAAVARSILAEVLPGEIQIAGDMEIAHYAAFAGEAGVMVIAGTGSIAYGVNRAGQNARAGGWGAAVSDEGSGHWVGKMAVAQLLRAHDRGARTAMLEAISLAWNVTSVNVSSVNVSGVDELVRAANATPAPDFSVLFPVVLRAAEAGDEVAAQVLQQAGEELAELGAMVAQRLFDGTESVVFATAGGVFRESQRVRSAFGDGLRARHKRVEIKAAMVDPVQGALAMARREQSGNE